MQSTFDPSVYLIGSRAVLHRGDTQGERIARVDFVQSPAGIVAVDVWFDYSSTRLCRVGNPRAPHAGEWPDRFTSYANALAFYFQANPKADRVTAEAAISRMVRDGEISVANLTIEPV